MKPANSSTVNLQPNTALPYPRLQGSSDGRLTEASELHRHLSDRCSVQSYADREAWKLARHGELFDRIGSSELAALFGCENAYDSQFSLYAKRIDPDVWAEAVEQEAANLYWGKRVERLILDEYSEQFGATCHSWPQVDYCVANDWPGFCTPDSIIVDEHGPLVAELKGYSEYDRKRWKDGPPIEIVLQNLHQQEVTGIHRGKVIVLFGNQIRRLGVFNIQYDPAFAKAIRERCERFAGYVQTRTEPPIDESVMTAEAIARLHPDDTGETTELPDESDEWLLEFEALKAAIAGNEKRLDWLKNQLCAAIGDSTYGLTPGRKWLSWKTQQRAGVDSALLKSLYPDAAKECEKVSKFRVLRTMANPPKDHE